MYQYRMNSDIMLLSNKLIYSDRLRCGSKAVAESTLVLPDREALDGCHTDGCRIRGCWVERVLDEGSVFFFYFGGPVKPQTEKNVGLFFPLFAVNKKRCKAVFIDTDGIPGLESRVGDLIQNEVEAKLVCQVNRILSPTLTVRC